MEKLKFIFIGADMSVDKEVVRILKEFQSTGKPIGLCCISPIIAAKGNMKFCYKNICSTLQKFN